MASEFILKRIRAYQGIILSMIIFGITLSCVFASAEPNIPKPTRYRVYSLKHISAEKGKGILEGLQIGTVSQLPNSNTLLVTADSNGLRKASAILDLVDSEEKYVVETVCSASEAANLPSNEEVGKMTGGIDVGTFSEPPGDFSQVKAIIDIHRDKVLAIAPEVIIGKVISALKEPAEKEEETQGLPSQVEIVLAPAEANEPEEAGQVTKPQEKLKAKEITKAVEKEAEQAVEPNAVTAAAEVNEVSSDTLFDELLDSLAKAEKNVEEKQKILEGTEKGIEKVLAAETSGQKPSREPNVPVAAKKVEVTKEPEEAKTEPKGEAGALEALLSQLAGRGEADRGEKISAESAVTEPNVSSPVSSKQAVRPVATKSRPSQPEPLGGKQGELELNLPSKLNIKDLLSLVGKYMELDFMYDEAKVKGQVTLNFRGPIKVKELYPLMESVLKFNKFIMTRKGNLIIIAPEKEVAEIDPTFYSKGDKVKVGDVVITRFFQLEYVDTASAMNLLKKMNLGTTVQDIEDTQTLIVTDYAFRMPRIAKLLSMLDQPGVPKQFRFRSLKYTLAIDLAGQVKKLAEELGAVSITVEAPAQKPLASAKSAAARRVAAARARQPAPKSKEPSPTKPVVYLDADERTNRVLMIGYSEDLDVVNGLIDALDVEKRDLRSLRLYEIQNVEAADVGKKLSELGIISQAPGGKSGVSGRITSRPTPSRTGAKTTTTPSAGLGTTAVEKAISGEPQVIVIEATNSLLVNATAEQHTQIALIIGYVDSETERASIPYMVYPLENQDPTELAGVLNQLIQETTKTQDKQGKITTSTIQKTEETIKIIPDAKSYSLIVYASKKNQQWLNTIIKQLDEYRPQVLLDVTLVEISNFDKFQFDLQALSSFPDLTDTSGLTGAIMPTSSTNLVEQLTSSSRDRFIDLQSLGGSGTGFYGDKHINLLLTAMQQKTYGRILARPKILVNDNEEGTIKAEEKEFQPEISSTNVISGTGAGTQQQSVNFKTYTAGVELKIQPHISKGNQLQLTITLNRTDFKEGSGGTVMVGGHPVPIPKTTLTSDVTTKITVPDGKTIILGGLEKSKQNKIGSKIPLLGDIPLVGGLFRDIDNTSNQSRLYVFVKAHILRPGEEAAGESDIVRISKANRAKFEKYEREMQEYEDWPGIKPEPMDPLKILEED